MRREIDSFPLFLMLSLSEKDFQVSKDDVVLLIKSVSKKMVLSQVIEPQTLI
jgi:hypothetical protein